ncbi:MAG: HAMP domain-containing histidine kinase [Clostridiales bacterium]|nr:HAMP domain-containing histidine kinase [Clostridiales bacterium]
MPDEMQHGEQPQKERSKTSVIFGGIFSAIVVLCGIAGGYGLTSLLYRATGAPPEFVRHILSGITGLLLVFAVMRIAMVIRWRHGQKDSHRFPHQRLIDDIQNALTNIAHGNFDIFVQSGDEGRGPLTDMAESVNRMAAKLGTAENLRQDFVSNVSHEIQSPITSVGGFAALLKNDGLDGETRRHYLEIIETECKRLSNLSNNLLKLSSLDGTAEPLKRTKFRADKQIKQAALMLEPQWTKKNLTLEADMEKAEIFGDESLLYEVWVNLINNAIKFTPEGGRIDITLSAQSDGTVAVAISDNGAGILAEDQPHIFERFYKADKSRNRGQSGSGLGLSLVKKIVELHGGRIEFVSEYQKGTTFTVFLAA